MGWEMLLLRMRHVAFMLVAVVVWTTGASPTASAADIVKVHMAARTMKSLPYLIADDLGYYSQEGIQFDGRLMNTSIGVMATLAGEIDVTQILGLSLRGAIEKDADLQIVMIFTLRPNYSLITSAVDQVLRRSQGQEDRLERPRRLGQRDI